MRLKIIFAAILGFTLFCTPLFLFDINSFGFVRRVGALVQWTFLESKYLYLIHHAMAGLPVLFFGMIVNLFHYRQVFGREFLKPILLLSLFFILWDFLFTYWGIWNFNPRYYSGWAIAGLPVEEWMWFWVIPFCSLFVYQMMRQKIDFSEKTDNLLSWTLLIVLGVLYLLNSDRLYTSWSLAASLLVLIVSILLKAKGIAVFMVSFLLNLIPMYLFNGMLTGLFTEEALVMYNPGEFSNLRIGTFPIEDLGFGFAYLYGIVLVAKFINRRESITYIAR